MVANISGALIWSELLYLSPLTVPWHSPLLTPNPGPLLNTVLIAPVVCTLEILLYDKHRFLLAVGLPWGCPAATGVIRVFPAAETSCN